MKKVFACIIMSALLSAVKAQSPYAATAESNLSREQDTTTLLSAFRRGHVHGHFRYFFMATENAPGLTDYYAHAAGGVINYETAPFKGFQFGVSGFFVFNMGSSDLSKPDPETGQYNRYEIGLFDITDADNKTNINGLEELYLKYNWKTSHIRFGKQLINTPFINPQDGRMRPSEAGGLWTELNEIRNTKIEAGFLYEFSPRGTVRWYSTDQSIGLYPAGVSTDGKQSQYPGNLKSGGVALLGVTHQTAKNLSLKAWDVFVENIFNTAMLQADINFPLIRGSNLFSGIQYIRQDAVNEGGNADAAKSYIQKGEFAQTFGATFGWENKQWKTSLNYNRITADGRYLMPREWGRDPFYTFLPRERNEGYGDANAYALRVAYAIPKARIWAEVGFGYFDLPDVNNYRLNKYGMPSYTQLNVDLRYSFKGFLKGLESRFLYVYKRRAASNYENNKYVINKVDMSSWNFVINYNF